MRRIGLSRLEGAQRLLQGFKQAISDEIEEVQGNHPNGGADIEEALLIELHEVLDEKVSDLMDELSSMYAPSQAMILLTN
jgi:hypothetical protein